MAAQGFDNPMNLRELVASNGLRPGSVSKLVKDTLVPISEVVHVWLQHLFCKVECHSLSVVLPGRFLLCYLVAPVFFKGGRLL